MQLRRFQADSAPLALDAIRRAFGDDAVILSNRQVDDHVEMIATGYIDDDTLASAVLDDAVDALREQPAAAKPAVDDSTGVEPVVVEPSSAEPASAVVSSAVFPNVTPGESSVEAEEAPATEKTAVDVPTTESACAAGAVVQATVESVVEPLSEKSTVRVTVDDDLAPQLETLVSIDSQSRGHNTQTDGGKRDVKPSQEVDASVSADTPQEADTGAEQFAAIGRIEQRLQRLEANLWGELEPLKNAHIEQLLKIGIGAELAVRLVERLGPNDTTETAIRQSLSLLAASLPIGIDNSTTEPGVTVVSGPAGSGKTTSLLKLARRQIELNGADSLVLISADTRGGVAFESLQFHGGHLGVPVVQARDSRELANLVGAFANKSLVLVDHMPLDHPEAFSLPALAADDSRKLRHLLVLSATMQACSLEAQAGLHRENGVSNLILTQLDSAARLGSCFAPLIRQHVPIAYWSDSADTAVSLQRADASILVATAMATARRFTASADEICQLNLMRPTRQDVSCNLPDANGMRLDATADAEIG